MQNKKLSIPLKGIYRLHTLLPSNRGLRIQSPGRYPLGYQEACVLQKHCPYSIKTSVDEKIIEIKILNQ